MDARVDQLARVDDAASPDAAKPAEAADADRNVAVNGQVLPVKKVALNSEKRFAFATKGRIACADDKAEAAAKVPASRRARPEERSA